MILSILSPRRRAHAPRSKAPRAPGARSASRGLMIALGTALALSVVIAPGIATPSTAAHADSTPAPTTPVGSVTVRLSPPSNGLVAPDTDLVLGVGVQNDTDADVTASSIVARLGQSPLASQTAIDSWLAGAADPADLQVVGTPSIGTVRSGGSADTSVTVAAAQLAGRAAGVYPVDVTVVGRSPVRSVVTFTGDPAQAKPVGVGIVVAITAGPRSSGLLSSSELTTLTATDGRLTALLDGISGSQAVLAIDPAIVASIRALGTAAPRTASAWLDRLSGLPNARFALQFADADVAAQAATGATAPLAPTSLAYALDHANFAAVTTTSGNGGTVVAPASPAPVPDDASLPDDATLTSIPSASGTFYWPAQGAVDAAIVQTLHAWNPSATTLVSSASLADPVATSTAMIDPAGSHVLAYDDDSSSAFARAAAASDADRAAAVAELAARAWTHARGATGPMLLASGRIGTVNGASLAAAIQASTGFAGATATSLPGLMAGETPTRLADAVPAHITQGTAALAQLAQSATRIDAFSPVLDTPAYLTGRERSAMLALVGAGWVDDPDAWNAALAQHALEVAATVSSVSIRPLATIQLFGSQSFIPVYVENGLPWPVSVTLRARSGDLRLEVDHETSVTAAPQGNTQVRIAVKATVANGEATLSLDLIDHTGQRVGTVQSANVYVRAEWERIGLGVLGGIVGLLIIVGLVRTVRRRRRRARAASTPEAPESADSVVS